MVRKGDEWEARLSWWSIQHDPGVVGSSPIMGKELTFKKKGRKGDNRPRASAKILALNRNKVTEVTPDPGKGH